jgi:hypothetical protein
MLKYLVTTQFAGLVMFVTIEFLEHMDIFTDSFNSFLLSLVYILLRLPHYFNLLYGTTRSLLQGLQASVRFPL